MSKEKKGSRGGDIPFVKFIEYLGSGTSSALYDNLFKVIALAFSADRGAKKIMKTMTPEQKKFYERDRKSVV